VPNQKPKRQRARRAVKQQRKLFYPRSNRSPRKRPSRPAQPLSAPLFQSFSQSKKVRNGTPRAKGSPNEETHHRLSATDCCGQREYPQVNVWVISSRVISSRKPRVGAATGGVAHARRSACGRAERIRSRPAAPFGPSVEPEPKGSRAKISAPALARADDLDVVRVLAHRAVRAQHLDLEFIIADEVEGGLVD